MTKLPTLYTGDSISVKVLRICDREGFLIRHAGIIDAQDTDQGRVYTAETYFYDTYTFNEYGEEVPNDDNEITGDLIEVVAL